MEDQIDEKYKELYLKKYDELFLNLPNHFKIDPREMRRRCYTLAAKTGNIYWEVLAERESW